MRKRVLTPSSQNLISGGFLGFELKGCYSPGLDLKNVSEREKRKIYRGSLAETSPLAMSARSVSANMSYSAISLGREETRTMKVGGGKGARGGRGRGRGNEIPSRGEMGERDRVGIVRPCMTPLPKSMPQRSRPGFIVMTYGN